MAATQPEVLQQMKTRIEQIEKLSLELKALGRGVPIIEKNARNILGAVYVLKFGISDVVEIDAA